MIKYIIISVISFAFGIATRVYIERLKRLRKYKKVKPLYKQDFEKAMKDLEIK